MLFTIHLLHEPRVVLRSVLCRQTTAGVFNHRGVVLMMACWVEHFLLVLDVDPLRRTHAELLSVLFCQFQIDAVGLWAAWHIIKLCGWSRVASIVFGCWATSAKHSIWLLCDTHCMCLLCYVWSKSEGWCGWSPDVGVCWVWSVFTAARRCASLLMHVGLGRVLLAWVCHESPEWKLLRLTELLIEIGNRLRIAL